MSCRFRKGHQGNKGGATRHGSRSSSSDAGAPLAPPVGETRARGRSDEAGPSNVDSMDHDGKHRGGLSGEAPKKRHKAIACDAPPSAAQVARCTRRSSASRCVHRCARARPHARTTCRRLRCGAGCRGDFGCTDRVDLAAACGAGLAAVCLPLHPSRACARFDRPSTRPLSAVRRCRNG